MDGPDGLPAGRRALDLRQALCERLHQSGRGSQAVRSRGLRRCGSSLAFLDFAPFIYDTDLHNFEKDLSILDLLMWNSPDAVV
jgi:hypothetical protein